MKLKDLLKVYKNDIELYVNGRFEGRYYDGYTSRQDYISKGNPKYLEAEVTEITIGIDDNSLDVETIIGGNDGYKGK